MWRFSHSSRAFAAETKVAPSGPESAAPRVSFSSPRRTRNLIGRLARDPCAVRRARSRVSVRDAFVVFSALP